MNHGDIRWRSISRHRGQQMQRPGVAEEQWDGLEGRPWERVTEG